LHFDGRIHVLCASHWTNPACVAIDQLGARFPVTSEQPQDPIDVSTFIESSKVFQESLTIMTHPHRRRTRTKGMETGSAVVQFIQRLFYIRKQRSSEYRSDDKIQVCRGVLVRLLMLMGFFGLFRKTTFSRGASTFMTTSSTNPPPSSLNSMESPSFDSVAVQAVVTAALWSFFAGDALASPTHWFYGGFRQVQQYYGPAGITGYTQPVKELAGSILNKSNLSGGGRSSTTARQSKDQPPTIIGHVINHGKQDWWDPNKSIHYHATLSRGENTLEASLARLLLQSLAANHGRFDAEHFRSAYVSFMTTPGSHNDTYASTCHRMFFANWYYRKLPPIDCPDNDRHNVDTIDGLVLPTITALAVALHRDGTVAQAAASAAATVAVTRNSALLERYAAEWATLVFSVVRTAAANRSVLPVSDTTDTATPTVSLARAMARNLGLRTPQVKASDEITACYLDSAVPAMLDTLVKYQPPLDFKGVSKPSAPWDSIWTGLLANANTGGENVHRGSCLGAVWGAVAAAATLPSTTTSSLQTSLLVNGLFHGANIQRDIQALLESIDQGDMNEKR
jgi:ADP-ribosyl-[dinitrogen reductase] hydrolase